jgi:hypothetical protein
MRPQSRAIRPRFRVRRGAAVAAVTLLALLTPALACATSFKALLHAPNHSPVENKKWWITVDVTSGTQKLSGDVSYRFLYAGTIVSHQPGHKFKNGLYKDWLLFPPAAVGKPLTLQVVVTTKYGTKYLPWTVKTVA